MSKKQLNGKKKTAEGARNVCVYCGSGLGLNPAYRAAAQKLGAALAMNDIGLVYGGGSLGLMGEVARATVDHGGRVIGIIPGFLVEKESMMRDVDEIIVTEDMHQRKRLMFDRSDAFVALPGGFGTLDELVEALTLIQTKKILSFPVILIGKDYWRPFEVLVERMAEERAIDPADLRLFVVTDDLEMGAISRHCEIGDAVVRAMMAGEDMLLICATPDKIRRGYQGLLAAARNGIISEQRIKESLERIARTKTIMEPPLPLDLDRFQSLANEILKLNSKLNYTYGGTVK